MASRTCFVSCLGPKDPSGKGAGVARCLREVFPSAQLVAVTDAGRSAVDPVFDEVWSVRYGSKEEFTSYAKELQQRLDAQSFFFPSLTDETKFFSQHLGANSAILAPPSSALEQMARPDGLADTPLPISVPPYCRLQRPDEVLHAFGRRHDWKVWLRQPGRAPVPITHWTDLGAARTTTGAPSTAGFLQAHREGSEESIIFSAFRGELLGAVRVERTRSNRKESRWTGRLHPVEAPLRPALVRTLQAWDWTGGAEIQCVRGETGTLWGIHGHPQFPAWIHGPTVHGVNLPGALAAAAWDEPLPSVDLADASSSPPAFARIMREVPVSSLDVPEPVSAFPSPFDSPGTSWRSDDGFLPLSSDPPARQPLPLTDDLRASLEDLPDPLPQTPCSLLLPSRATDRFARFQEATQEVSQAFGGCPFQIAYSIKTNPHPQLLQTARDQGMWAETIHPDEVDHARRCGFPKEEIVVNGPLQQTLHAAPEAFPLVRAVFADSLRDLQALKNLSSPPPIVGLRVRPTPPLSSRFGIDLTDREAFERCGELLADLPADVKLGLHVHHASSTAGHNRWWEYLRGAVYWGNALSGVAGRPIQVLDFGGGWHPDDWTTVFLPGLVRRSPLLTETFPHLELLMAEPGKALCQPLGVVVARVVDVRPGGRNAPRSAVLDASIAELSNIDFHPHRICARSGGTWRRLPRGDGRLYGRLCMEEDVLASGVDLRWLQPGDSVVFLDAGAYDMSMTYPFGRGGSMPSQRLGSGA